MWGSSGSRDDYSRIAILNDGAANSQHGFPNNSVSTSKYKWWNFVFKNLTEQFMRLANSYFLLISILQQVPNLSPTGKYTTLFPLTLVLLVTMFKEGYEDRQRSLEDKRVNNRKCLVYREGGEFVEMYWHELAVGDVVQCYDREIVPADIVLLGTSSPQGDCYIETSSLDGETNLKIRQSCFSAAADQTPEDAAAREGLIRFEAPNQRLYSFIATYFTKESSPLAHEARRKEIEKAERIMAAQPSRGFLAVLGFKGGRRRGSSMLGPSASAASIAAGSPKVKATSPPHHESRSITSGLGGDHDEETPLPVGLPDASGSPSSVMMAPVVSENTTVASVSGRSSTIVPPAPSAGSSVAATHDISGGMLHSGGHAGVPLGADQLLLRGAVVRNTRWVVGVVVYTGTETKIVLNSEPTPAKRTQVERVTNRQITLVFAALCVLAASCAIGSYSWHTGWEEKTGYLENSSSGIFRQFFTFLILFNNLIPISLYVSMEMVKIAQATLINSDLQMYDVTTKTPAQARTSNLNEELGQVSYVFSDKTGTLTENQMRFRRCSVNGVIYGARNPSGSGKKKPKNKLKKRKKKGSKSKDDEGEDGIPEAEEEDPSSDIFRDSRLLRDLKDPQYQGAETLRSFLTIMSVCHTVVPEPDTKIPGRILYQASSPDEGALVEAASSLGYEFRVRTLKTVTVAIEHDHKQFDILAVLPFTSSRKRMSVVVRDSEGKILLLCKGADSTLYPRLKTSDPYSPVTLEHLSLFAGDGLRTLVMAQRELTSQEFSNWFHRWHSAQTALENRQEQIAAVASELEADLTLVGASGIEDKLQAGVPETIETLQKAGMRIWVLTGDKRETAVNVGYSCKLLGPHMRVKSFTSYKSVPALKAAMAEMQAEVDEALGPVDPSSALIYSGSGGSESGGATAVGPVAPRVFGGGGGGRNGGDYYRLPSYRGDDPVRPMTGASSDSEGAAGDRVTIHSGIKTHASRRSRSKSKSKSGSSAAGSAAASGRADVEDVSKKGNIGVSSPFVSAVSPRGGGLHHVSSQVLPITASTSSMAEDVVVGTWAVADAEVVTGEPPTVTGSAASSTAGIGIGARISLVTPDAPRSARGSLVMSSPSTGAIPGGQGSTAGVLITSASPSGVRRGSRNPEYSVIPGAVGSDGGEERLNEADASSLVLPGSMPAPQSSTALTPSLSDSNLRTPPHSASGPSPYPTPGVFDEEIPAPVDDPNSSEALVVGEEGAAGVRRPSGGVAGGPHAASPHHPIPFVEADLQPFGGMPGQVEDSLDSPADVEAPPPFPVGVTDIATPSKKDVSVTIPSQSSHNRPKEVVVGGGAPGKKRRRGRGDRGEAIGPTGPVFALLVDGDSLHMALEPEVRHGFLALATRCQSVICCRVSPIQKAHVVRLVRESLKAVTLAIGDGANDVSMIQAAHVGIGISGNEGLQAARSSDYSIVQFRYLKRLLLVHGRYSYRRISRLVVYSFYKNIALYLTQLWFTLQNGFSGQTLYESWTVSVYNVLFTSFPIMVLGVFDQDVDVESCLLYPELYRSGQRGDHFNSRVFWAWVGNAIWHSLIALFGGMLATSHSVLDVTGRGVGLWGVGVTVYTSVVLIVTLKLSLEMRFWPVLSHVAVWGSVLLWFVYLLVYSQAYLAFSLAPEMSDIAFTLMRSPIYWATCVLCVVAALLRDVVWKFFKRTYRPRPYHLVQEISRLRALVDSLEALGRNNHISKIAARSSARAADVIVRHLGDTHDLESM